MKLPHSFAVSASRSVLVILLTATLAVAAGSGSSSAAVDVTVYTIQNRWKQFIYDAGAKVAYDQGKGLQVPCDELDIIEAYDEAEPSGADAHRD